MGGDHAPGVVVEGAVRAAAASGGRIHTLLVGDEAAVRAELARLGAEDRPDCAVLHAPEVISMAEAPATAVKQKQRSSIHLGLGAHQRGLADAFISAGNTGAVMAASLFILGRLENVSRPAVLGFFPTTRSYCIALDVGANMDCKPEHLVRFAQMGAVYARTIMRRPEPTVALLNVGEEPGKGSESVKAAYELLESLDGVQFVGNIEGRDVLHHGADVVVCDGFVGNALLKFGESIATALHQMLERAFEGGELPEDQRSALLGAAGSVHKRFDYEEYGGAPLLGVNGNVLIGHGGSSARAIERLVTAAADLVEQNVSGGIAELINR